MSYRVIVKQEWQNYFDDISKKMKPGQLIEMEVAGKQMGDQKQQEKAKFKGISYDPRTQLLNVYTDVLDHAIEKPQEVVAVEEGAATKALSIKDAEGYVQSIKFQ
jgi:type IV secretory pathway VirB6-like protein